MSTPSFKYGNGVWATKEGSSLAYNDDNGHYKPLPFSVSRASSATRVNKQGLIEVVGNDRLRIDYSESANGVALLEPSRSNLITYSEDFSQWSTIQPTLTSNYGISPDGSVNSTRCVFSSSNLALEFTVSTSNAIATIYIKGTSGETIQFGTNGAEEIFILNGDWQRLEKYNSSSIARVTLNTYAGATARDIEIYGAQLEQGSYATSYIPTSGSTATRQADVANGAGVANVFNDSEGVLFADIAALADDSTNKMYSLSDGTNTNRLYVSLNTDTISVNLRVGGATQFGLSHNVSDSTTNHKIVIKYKLNDFALWVDGFEVSTSSSGNVFASNTLSKLSFDRADGVDYFYGKAKAINVYQTALTDAELEYLTSYRSLAEMATELNLNAL